MAFGTRVGFDALRSLGFASISGTYAALGTALARHCRILKITNTSNGDITVSFDGATDNDLVPARSFVLYDFTSDQVQQDGFFLSVGTQIYIKGSASSGSVYASVIDASAGGV